MRSKRSKIISLRSLGHVDNDREEGIEQIYSAGSHAAVPVQYSTHGETSSDKGIVNGVGQLSGVQQQTAAIRSATTMSPEGVQNTTNSPLQAKFEPANLQPNNVTQFQYNMATRHAAVPLQMKSEPGINSQALYPNTTISATTPKENSLRYSAKATAGVMLEEKAVDILTFLPDVIIRAETSYLAAVEMLPLDFLKHFGINKKEVYAAFKHLKTGINDGKFDITYLKNVTSYLKHLNLIKTLYDAFHVWKGVFKLEKQLKENEKLSEEEQVKAMAKLYMEYMPFITIIAKDDKDLENVFKKIIGWAKGKPELVDRLREWSGKPPIDRTLDTQPTTHSNEYIPNMSSTEKHRKEGQSNLEKIASKQSIHELAAHDIAYKSDFSAISVETLIQLRNAGYGSRPEDITFHFGKLGFQAVVIHSVTKGKPSILAIRGTTPGLSRNALETIYSDLDPRAVGAKQFEQNAVLINSLLQLGGAPMIVTGHSLGGAMAQHVAVNFSDMITEVTTFQSPGIDQSSVDKFNKMKNKPKVTHHIVTGDAVDKAGDANLEGDVYEHDFGLQLNLMELSSTLKSSEATIMLHLRAAAQAALVLDSMTKRRELSAAKAEIETLVKFLTVTVTNIGTSHGKMIFEEYRKNASKKPTQEQEITHQVGHFRSHPHQNERAVAEDIRDVVGTKIEKHIERYFVLLDSYDKIKSTATNLKDELKSSYEQSKNAILKKVESFF